ncbi:transmembrane protein 107-like [Macrosteles quadrilineatus]|uniref:transmembrane protein 107-like n=1 Tax=Macrosteles quadrilineatus TaxID=74068 RepID=UPI0023E17293|nr:transmembrane protein 107-like [Macrosteles quadrilineatus]XP_054288945.1 transmembrane protein 107-like [Macrosteles quadrilineatus]XP_054289054.1 transmembrane protein 107-like [Macrosteles quadrilineatus]XP_054289055.1 transmembrane protein 107-like [Macrosteles quadrilineatus]
MISHCGESLIPARFLILLAHMTICLVTLSYMNGNIKTCLPEEYEESDYDTESFHFRLGLYLGLGLIAIEFLGFLSGTSMFLPSVATLSVGCHASACVLMSQSLLDDWSCHSYWWIFFFCSLIPGLVELAVAVNMHLLKPT